MENEDINQLVNRILSLVESLTAKLKAWELERGMPYVYNEEQLNLLGQLAKDFEAMFGPKEEMPLVLNVDESADEKPDFNVDESAVFDKFVKALKANGGNISPSLFKLHGTAILILKKENSFIAIVADGRITICYKSLPGLDHVFDDKAIKVEKVWDTYLATSSGHSLQGEEIVRVLNSAPKDEGIAQAINAAEEYVMETYGENFGAFTSSVCVVGANFCRVVGANLLPEVLEEGLEVFLFGSGGIHAIDHLMKKVKLQELRVFESAVEHMKQALAVSSIKEPSVGGHPMIGKINDEKVEIEKFRPHMCKIIARDYTVFKDYLRNGLLVFTLFTNPRKPSTEYHFRKYFQDNYPDCQVVTLRAKKKSKEYLQEHYPNSKVDRLRDKKKCLEICRLVTFCHRYQLYAAVRAFGRGEVEIGLEKQNKVCARYKFPSANAFQEIVFSKKDLKRLLRKAKKADLKREKSHSEL